MCLRPSALQLVPQLTALVAHAAFPKGNVYLQIRDELGTIYQDEDFTDLFPKDGQPAFSPARLGLVTIMQFIEKLTDRQAADAVRSRIDWKYMLGLELTDPGFDFSVLSEFRSRLISGAAEQRLLDLMLQVFKQRGWLKAGGRQRTDSTHIVAAVRHLSNLESVGETMRHTLNTLAVICPGWLRPRIKAEWTGRYERPFSEYNFPKTEAALVELAQTIGGDGAALLNSIYTQAPGWVVHLPCVDLLRRVWLQHFFYEEGILRWRRSGNLPPAALQICSPYDTEVRFSHKRSTAWLGYKVHLTETCDSDAPLVITHVETTLATLQDVSVVDKIHEDLSKLDLQSKEHFVDMAYVSSDVLVTSARFGTELVGPVRGDPSWQARGEQSFSGAQFRIDWEAKRADCPAGKSSHSWFERLDWRDKLAIHAVFRKSDCQACALRERCTKGSYRLLTLQRQEEYEALQQARIRQQTPEFRARYKVRAGIEGTISQAVHARRMRRTRYVGLAKTRLQHVATAAGINLTRTADWLSDRPRAKTHVSAFVALSLAA